MNDELTDTRARLLRSFERWLDETLAREDPTDGFAEEFLAELERDPAAQDDPDRGHPFDLYSLWEAMTTLGQEVKLQGRAFQQLSEEVRTLQRGRGGRFGEADAEASRGRALEARGKQEAQESEQEAPWLASGGHRSDPAVSMGDVTLEEMIGLLIDLRERLERGWRSSLAHGKRVQKKRKELRLGKTPKPRRLKKLLKHQSRLADELVEGASAVSQGCRLSLDRVDEALARLGVTEIACGDRVFDPHSMTAVAVEESAGAPTGMVLEVCRPGFRWNDRLFRPAEVKVARGKEDGGQK